VLTDEGPLTGGKHWRVRVMGYKMEQD